MSTTLNYCSCNPKSKPASEREPAEWYCFRHRRHLCDNCIYDELNQRHISCLVGTYDEFIKSPAGSYSKFKKNKCPICDKELPDDNARAVVRLNCACVYHTNCLQSHLLSHPSNNIPCIKCKQLMTKTANKKSNLSESVHNFLRSVSRQRLWHKPKTTQNGILNENNETEIIEEKEIGTHSHSHSDSHSHSHSDSASTVRGQSHISVDMTRHRTVNKMSMNRDGNMEDDKYNKPNFRKRNKLIKGIKGIKSGKKSWFSTRKTLVVLLLCCALIAQCWFLYMVFIKKNVDDNNGNNEIGMGDKVRKQQGNIEGMLHNLPPKLKQEILGDRLKKQQMQKKLID